MKRPAKLLLAAYLSITIAAGSGFAIGAEGVATQQDLVNVKASNMILSAAWTRQDDSYTLQIVLDRMARPARTTAGTTTLSTEEARQQGRVNVADALNALEPQPVAGDVGGDRASFFIGNTIAKLRGLNPTFCGRTLSLVDGRRTLPQQDGAVPAPVKISNPPVVSDPRVAVWILRADGKQIQPATYTCEPGIKASPVRDDDTISYEFSAVDGAQAIAAAIRIGDSFYIEKLQPLNTASPVQ